jgi:hypothetical protein
LIIESYPKSEQENASLMENHQAKPCQRASQKSCAEVKRSRKVVSDYVGMAERGSFIQAPGGAAELAGIIQERPIAAQPGTASIFWRVSAVFVRQPVPRNPARDDVLMQ